MSRSFGPIESRADFFAGLASSLAYARSDAFWDATLKSPVQLQLQAIVAWTDGGRTPLLAERDAVNLSWMIARAREETEGSEPAEWIDRIELVRKVSWYFASWPENDAIGRTARYYGAMSAPRKPSLDEIRDAASVLYTELVATNRIDAQRPPESAFQSKQPLMRDQLSPTSWVQWVLLPRLEAMVRGETPVPPKSQLCTLCMHLAEDRALWRLLYALGRLDDLFLAPMKNFDP